MIPLPGSLGTGEIIGWRLDNDRFKTTWASGEGAFRLGGRWNSKGVRAVYASIDFSTAILEVAVHKGFRALDTVAHVITSFEVLDASKIHIVNPGSVPNRNWLRPGIPSSGQQKFGDSLLSKHPFVMIPSAVSTYSWNLVLDPEKADGLYGQRMQKPLALDTRLNPPA